MNRIASFSLVVLLTGLGAAPGVLTPHAARAQVPTVLGYQAALTDPGGSPVADGNHTVVFRLYDVSQGGSPLWSETQLVAVSNGVFSTVLGTQTPLTLPFDRPYWLGVSLDGGPEMAPRRRLTAAAYSLTARTVEPGGAVRSINGLADDVNLVGGPNVSVTQSGHSIVITTSASGGGTGGGGNTLDMAYDQGGPGAGARIVADSGPVVIAGAGGLSVEGRVSVGPTTNVPQVPLEVYSGDVYAVYGETQSGLDAAAGVFGALNNTAAGPGASGVIGVCVDQTAQTNGVWGDHATVGLGVFGTSQDGFGVAGLAWGTQAENVGVYGESKATGVGWAGYMFGDLGVVGQIYTGSAAFLIDHPLAPQTRVLVHSAVHSPDMMNVYNGNVTLDANGEAQVRLPAYFEALNGEYRYQLTPIGAPAPGLYVAREISGNTFRIAGGRPGMKVSWMVTGIRRDATAMHLNRRVERDKRPSQRGRYVDPAAYGAPRSQSLIAAAHPTLLERMRAGLRVRARRDVK